VIVSLYMHNILYMDYQEHLATLNISVPELAASRRQLRYWPPFHCQILIAPCSANDVATCVAMLAAWVAMLLYRKHFRGCQNLRVKMAAILVCPPSGHLREPNCTLKAYTACLSWVLYYNGEIYTHFHINITIWLNILAKQMTEAMNSTMPVKKRVTTQPFEFSRLSLDGVVASHKQTARYRYKQTAGYRTKSKLSHDTLWTNSWWTSIKDTMTALRGLR
jgi:hypothetical protein